MADFEIPGYEIYERLGRGGMATVYRALHLNLDREVAIKVMDASMSADENFSERFIREARISARLTHPHILQIYDVNSFDGMNYIAMEYLPGGDMAGLIRGPLTQAIIYTLMEQMTDALDYAASHGYVHRDIKPSNIMLRGDTDFVLADFGIAKAADSGTQMTQTGLMVGTPSYMSPEQAKGITVDGRSDLYSLGVLWFEMTTKKLPFDADSAVSTAVKHLTEDIPTLPDELAAYQEFLNKALAKSADDRFQSGREMFQALSEHRSNFPDDAVLVEPEPVPEGEEPGQGEPSFDPAKTSATAWSDETRVSQSSSSRPSRPYKLSETSRERLSSGFHTGARRRPAKSSSGGVVKALLGLAVVGALGFGGYYYLQQQGGTASTEDLRNVTAELAEAYSALNDENLDKAAIAFRKVLSLDSNNAAAQQGLQDLESMYTADIEEAIAGGELDRASNLISDYGLHFADSGSHERLKSALALAQQEQELEDVQSERVKILLDKAMAAMNDGRLFEPNRDNAYEYFMQITALNAGNSAAKRGLNQLMTSALEQARGHIGEKQFAAARDVINQARGIDPAYPALIKTQQEVESAEEAELRRQNRWAEYTEERREALNRLLEDADRQVTAEQYLTPEGDNAYETYLAVLEQDPDSELATRGLENLATIFLAREKEALDAQRFDDAEQALANVSRVVPNHPELEARQAGLRAARQQYEEASARDAYVTDLLSEAQSNLENAPGNLEAAREAQRLYEEVLSQVPDSSAAAQGLSDTAEAYFAFAKGAVQEGDFESAAEALGSATALDPQRNDIINMQSQLADIEAAWREQNNEEQLLAEASSLFKDGNYSEAAEAYSRVAELYPDSSSATDGFEQSIAALVTGATKAAASGKFDAAETMLDYALSYAPDIEGAAKLKAQLPDMQQAWQQEQQARAQALEQANQVSTRGLQAITSGDLDAAQAAYDELLADSPDFDVTSRLRLQLRDAYLLATRDEINNQAYDLAEDFLLRGKTLAPDHPDWAELEVEVEIGKSSSRRRLGEF